VLEVADPADRSALPPGAGVEVEWVTGDPARPGSALLDAVRARPPWPETTYCWFAADQETAAALRRHAVQDRGHDPELIMFMGYWRTDGSLDPD
jgi:NADPH-dependent ferric siderophore reductase